MAETVARTCDADHAVLPCSLSLGRLLAVSKHLHQLTSASEILWRRAVVQEFGLEVNSRLFLGANNNHRLFSMYATSDLASNLQCEARHDSFLQAIQQWQIRLTSHSSEYPWHSHVFIDNSKQILATPQSCWVKFEVPKRYASSVRPLELTVQVETSLHERSLPLIVSQDFKLPKDDMQMLMQSHREGLYIWSDDDGEGEGGGMVSIMAYIHYEQIFLTLSNHGWLDLLPQSLPLPCMPFYWPASLAPPPPSPSLPLPLETLFIVMDWSQLNPLPGSRFTRGSAVVHLCSTGPSAFSSDMGGLKVALIPSDRHSLLLGGELARDQDDKDKTEMLEALCLSDGMIDFSIWTASGRLILGRAGVEVWLKDEEEEVNQSYCCHFLVDNGPKGQSLWNNRLWIRPRSNRRKVVELELPIEIASLLLK